MTITYRPSRADLIHAARAWEGQHWRVARYTVASGLVACGAFLGFVGGRPWWGSIFVLFGVLEALNLLPAAVVRALLEWKLDPKFREEYELTLTSASLRFRTPTIDSTLKWTHYLRFFETRRAFILVYGRGMYTVIPKRALQGDEQVDELRTLLAEVIGRAGGGRLTTA